MIQLGLVILLFCVAAFYLVRQLTKAFKNDPSCDACTFSEISQAKKKKQAAPNSGIS